MEEKYRIFLSYRDSKMHPDGKNFMKKLYKKICHIPNYKETCGVPYFSPESDITGSYLDFHFLKNTEYFIIPYTEDFFLNMDPENKPVVIKEIEAAITFNPQVTFIVVLFPGFDETTIAPQYKKMLSPQVFKQAGRLIGAKTDGERKRITKDYSNEENIIDSILDDIYNPPIRTPNVYMTTKEKLEEVPLFHRLNGVKKLTMINFAGTSFISGELCSATCSYDNRSRFYRNLHRGQIEVEIVFTTPDSFADRDAALYKMRAGAPIRPEIAKGKEINYEKLSVDKLPDYLISYNFNRFVQYALEHPEINITIYHTDIVLPSSFMKCEFDDSDKDFIQLCLYFPLEKDTIRPAFSLKKNDPATEDAYRVIDGSLNFILTRANRFTGHPDTDFLFKHPIVHRTKLDLSRELSRDAIERCAQKGYSFEFDLYFFEDEILVSRKEIIDGYEETVFCMNNCLQALIDSSRDEKGVAQLMTLSEMLALLEKIAEEKQEEPVSLLAEMKDYWDCDEEEIRRHVIQSMDILTKYKGKFAMSSANPKVLQAVKNYDVRIPCGIITLDFEQSKYKDEVSSEYIRIHKNAEYINYVIPDFISGKIGDFSDYREGIYKDICTRYGIKKLGWYLTDQSQYNQYRKIYDNLLIEYDPDSEHPFSL